ncbi:MAG: hypothetical protein M1480_11750 [Bacteroidetes bacterium]|nr:hypothetical protein [Bacteroidota bacterium]
MSLYSIGDEYGIEAIKNEVGDSKDEKLKNICSAIYQDYLDNQKKYLSTNP